MPFLSCYVHRNLSVEWCVISLWNTGFFVLVYRKKTLCLLCWRILFLYHPLIPSKLFRRGSSLFLKSLVRREQNGFMYFKENMPLLILHLLMYLPLPLFSISLGNSVLHQMQSFPLFFCEIREIVHVILLLCLIV